MPEIFMILINILKQCTYCTSIRRNKDSLICQCRICYLLLPELSRSFQNIENIFSVLRALKFQRIRKKDFHFMTDDLSLCILEPCSFKNSKINFLAEDFAVGNVVKGKVARMTDFGAFVELAPGVDALLHVSQISREHVAKPADVLSIGQEIEAKVVDFNGEDKKISLSMKALEAPAEEATEE